MGYIQQANDIIENSTQLLDDILSSNFNQFIQGLGQPVLVKYWNLNDTLTTANSGTDTVDENIGPESPNRFNKIENFPLYGALRDMIPEITQDDNLLDMELNVECVILPDTIKPSSCDYFEYTWKDKSRNRSVIFKVNDVQLSTIRSNGYYKIECNMIDIDHHNGYSGRIDKQVVKNFDVNLDTLGTNDKCIIESKHLKHVRRIESIIEDITSQYINLFYSDRYNALIYTGMFQGDFLAYDPYLTIFIIQNNLLSNRGKKSIMLVNYDDMSGFRQKYNMTLFHAIEIKSMKYLKELRYFPERFSRVNTNPFSYYGEEVAFKIDLYPESCRTIYTMNKYMGLNIKNNIIRNEKGIVLNEFESMLVDYFNKENLCDVLTEDIIVTLEEFSIEYTEYWFQFTPILIFILKAIRTDINNSYN